MIQNKELTALDEITFTNLMMAIEDLLAMDTAQSGRLLQEGITVQMTDVDIKTLVETTYFSAFRLLGSIIQG